MHDRIRDIAGQNCAIGVSHEVLAKLFDQVYRQASQAGNLQMVLPVPTTNLEVTLQERIGVQPPQLSVGMHPIYGQSLRVIGLAFNLVLHTANDPADILTTLAYDNPELWLQAFSDLKKNGELSLRTLDNGQPTLNFTGFPPTQAQLDMHFGGSLNEFDSFKWFLRISSSDSVADGIGRMIPMPRLLESLRYFRFLLPATVSIDQDYLVLSGPRVDMTPIKECACPNANSEITWVSQAPIVDSQGAITRFTTTFDFTHNPPQTELLANFENPDTFYYIPQSKSQEASNLRLVGGVSAGDRGEVLLVYWEWRGSVLVDLGSVRVGFGPQADGFNIGVTFNASGTGDVSAGIVIGCIREEVIGASLSCNLNNVTVRLKAYFDRDTKSLKYASRGAIGQVDVNVDARFIFPINKVIDIIAEQILEGLIKRLAVEKFNALRGTILDLARLGPGYSAYSASENYLDRDGYGSVLYGVRNFG